MNWLRIRTQFRETKNYFTKFTLLTSAAVVAAEFTLGMSVTATPAGAKELKIATFMGPPYFLNRVASGNLAKAIGRRPAARPRQNCTPADN